jgi:hypothetical protein
MPMKKSLLYLLLVYILCACPKNEDPEPKNQDLEPNKETTTVPLITNGEISSFDNTITKKNADYAFNYKVYFQPSNSLKNFNTLQRTAILEYFENGVPNYFDNKVYLNDTLLNLVYDPYGQFKGRNETKFNQDWITKEEAKLTLEIRSGIKLQKAKFLLANQVLDTISITPQVTLAKTGDPFTFTISKLPIGADSVFITYIGTTNRVQIEKSYKVTNSTLFTLSADETAKLVADRDFDVLYVDISVVKYLSGVQNGKKILAEFTSGTELYFDIEHR